MPSHRRARQSAAKLPHDRLPLGTHLPGSQTARPTSQATDYSDSSRRGASSPFEIGSDTDAIPRSAKKSTTSGDTANTATMSTSGYDSDRPHLTTAEDKLRRQQERIKLAEASLNAASHGGGSRPQSRAKGKTKWEPIDIGWDIAEPPQQAPETETPPVSQVRVNTYSAYMPPPLSRDISLSRSLSSVSAQTGIDADRHDSFFDNVGFQTYRRGRGVKAEELKPYEDKPEEKQKTVEATFDKHAIYEVFGAELPGSGYMDSIVGAQDGQLQFVQHPNGDVSAHMWSYERYGWQNIGSFSNIRKKIEGQLARDRLRGETASQALQKNSLAYFRAIAKQREYNARGMEFGQAEIQQLLPNSESVKGPSLGLQGESFSSVSASSEDNHHVAPAQPDQGAQPQQRRRGVPADDISQPVPTASRQANIERLALLQEQKSPNRFEDPFTSMGLQKNIMSRVNTTTSNQFSVPPTPPGMTAPLFTSEPPSRNQPEDTARRASAQKPSVPAVPNLFPLFIPKSSNASLNSGNDRRQSPFDTVDTPLRQKASTPFETREAMRDHLFKLGESAKERSLSQANVRTVLYDPFQSQRTDSTKQSHDHGNDYSRHSASQEHQSFSQTETADNYFMPAQWTDRSSIIHTQREYNLADSVPDNTVPFNAAPGSMVNGGFTRTYDRLPSNPYDDSNWRDPDEELKEWWTSGNKFSRQEDFYQSIKTLALSSTADTSTPSSRPRPIGAPPLTGTPSARAVSSPAKQQPTDRQLPWNESTTRILIPVYENLAAYVQGPADQRRDYWCRWSQPPEWCIDRGPNGNNSFFDNGWGQPPARVGRDPRYRPLPGEMRFGGFQPGSVGSPGSMRGGIPGFPGYGGRY